MTSPMDRTTQRLHKAREELVYAEQDYNRSTGKPWERKAYQRYVAAQDAYDHACDARARLRQSMPCQGAQEALC